MSPICCLGIPTEMIIIIELIKDILLQTVAKIMTRRTCQQNIIMILKQVIGMILSIKEETAKRETFEQENERIVGLHSSESW